MKRSREPPALCFAIKGRENISLRIHNASGEDKHFGDGKTDQLNYVLYLRPPLRNADLTTYGLVITYGETSILETPLFPRAVPNETVDLFDRSYAVFETHAISQDFDTRSITYAVYVQLENHGRYAKLKIEPGIDMSFTLETLFGKDRYKRLAWYPTDINPADYGVRLDPRIIPQRTPLWFRLRGEVTGTKAYMLIGYYTPDTWGEEGEFSAFQRDNMRLGTYSEEYAIMLMLLCRPHISIAETGLCPAGPPCPIGWGASPDGIIVDTTMDWNDVSKSITKHLVESDFDVTRGVLEIKTTGGKDMSMKAYYYPQVYMEMISTGTMWCDLVRYHRTDKIARVYRVYRHKPTEERLVQLIKYAYNNRHRIQDVIAETPFVEMRQYFADAAKTLAHVELAYPAGNTELETYELRQREIRTVPVVVHQKKHQKIDISLDEMEACKELLLSNKIVFHRHPRR